VTQNGQIRCKTQAVTIIVVKVDHCQPHLVELSHFDSRNERVRFI